MPFIETKTNLPITDEKAASIKSAYGTAISTLGKSEGWLMLRFAGNCQMFFQGNDDPCAIAEVKLYGKASPKAYGAFTAQVTDILARELGLPAGRIYVKYEECAYWGLSGSNF